MARLHDDEIEIDEDLVRSLLSAHSTAYDGLPLRRFASSGSTNALFRLGGDLLVRVPRQPGGSRTIEKERRWLPDVARVVPVAVPEILDMGEPGFGYSEKWSIVRFLDGEPPALPVAAEPPRHDLARDLASVVRALRDLPVPEEALGDRSLQWYRGKPLARLDDDMRRYLDECRDIDGLDLDVDAAAAAWAETLSLPEAHDVGETDWLHADLLAENLLARDGRLTAVLDFGALSVGNSVVDLMVAWELLDPEARVTFRGLLDVDDATWRVARGWALALSVMTFPYYWTTMPERCADRLVMGHAVLADVQAEVGSV
jgi:aminoglycoside phosphotransferase (APT) family kinase protein